MKFLILVTVFLSHSLLISSQELSENALTTNVPSMKIQNVCSLCSNNGFCVEGNQCSCFDKWATFGCQNNTGCCYKRKSQTTAFVLNFIFGAFGAGNWYLKRADLAWIQLGPFLGGLLFACCFAVCLVKCDDDSGKTAYYCYILLWVLAMISLHIYFLVILGKNEVEDNNGVLPKGW